MNEVVAHEIVSLQRCVARAREEHASAGATFGTNLSAQDAALLNLIRACESGVRRPVGGAPRD
jgi:hypothetical protein